MAIDAKFGPNLPLIGAADARQRLGTPALVLDLDALDRNIENMAAHLRAKGHGLRPVAKVHKSVEIARRQTAGRTRGVLRYPCRG